MRKTTKNLFCLWFMHFLTWEIIGFAFGKFWNALQTSFSSIHVPLSKLLQWKLRPFPPFFLFILHHPFRFIPSFLPLPLKSLWHRNFVLFLLKCVRNIYLLFYYRILFLIHKRKKNKVDYSTFSFLCHPFLLRLLLFPLCLAPSSSSLCPPFFSLLLLPFPLLPSAPFLFPLSFLPLRLSASPFSTLLFSFPSPSPSSSLSLPSSSSSSLILLPQFSSSLPSFSQRCPLRIPFLTFSTLSPPSSSSFPSCSSNL